MRASLSRLRRLREATMSGLTPDALYRYRMTADGGWSYPTDAYLGDRINEYPKLGAPLKTEFGEYPLPRHRDVGRGWAVSRLSQAGAPQGARGSDWCLRHAQRHVGRGSGQTRRFDSNRRGYNRETLALPVQIRQDATSLRAPAAEARRRVLNSQSPIALRNAMLPTVKEELDEHKKECTWREFEPNSQIDIVTGNPEVMAGLGESAAGPSIVLPLTVD